MRLIISFVVISLLYVPTAEARPSVRSIQDAAEHYNDAGDAGWYKQYFDHPEYGLRLTYPSSWNTVEEGTIQATDGSTCYEYFRLQPPDFGFDWVSGRPNYILELEVLVWDVGKEFNAAELDTFGRTESAARYNEFWIDEATEIDVAGYPAWRYRINSMSGEREEVWLSAGRYVYTFGYRSLADYYEDNRFFFDEMVDSAVINAIEPEPIITSTPTPNPNPNPTPGAIFNDVEASHPYSAAIDWAKTNGVLSGYPDGTFRPDRTVNRAEFLKIVLEAAGVDIGGLTGSSFPDVDQSAWYAPYIAYALQMGIVEGYEDGTFRPEQTVNVTEALKIVYLVFDVDTDRVAGEWYQRYLSHAQSNNVLFSNDLQAGEGMKRRDVVWVVWRLNNM